MYIAIGYEIFDSDNLPPPRKFPALVHAVDDAFLARAVRAAEGKPSVPVEHNQGLTAAQLKAHRAEAVEASRALRKLAEGDGQKIFDAQEKAIAAARIAGPFMTRRETKAKLRELTGLDKKEAAMAEAVAALGGAPSVEQTEEARRKAAAAWQKSMASKTAPTPQKADKEARP